jgi:4-hydroxythreonine-4-phosphate dehydrogenase
MTTPLLALTMGDPSGVGPEVIVGAWPNERIHQWCRPLVVGHPEFLRRAIAVWTNRPAVSRLRVVEVNSPEDAEPSPETIPCISAGPASALDVPPATVDARSGQVAYDALVLAAHWALAGRVDAITTAPLNKAALWKAGHEYPGHTELLAELCGVDDFAMMLYLGPDATIRSLGGLGVIHVTLHMALHDVFTHLSVAEIVRKIRLASTAMQSLKNAPARIGVCALNPHAGESGLFGNEEATIIQPAVEEARAAGLDVEGPFPTDTLMVRARDGEFDGIVAMYHDQGHIALKLLGMHRAVNVTLGLPIVRTSVAHGTAFDLAWQGRAETSSMVEAIRVAAGLAGKKITTIHQ